jgi:hypothetical protein
MSKPKVHDPDCGGCKNESVDICPNSKKPCGHHGNEFWVFEFCDACGKENIDDWKKDV